MSKNKVQIGGFTTNAYFTAYSFMIDVGDALGVAAQKHLLLTSFLAPLFNSCSQYLF